MTTDLFKPLDEYEKKKLSDGFERISYEEDDYIITEGEYGDKARFFYLIEKGSCYATKTLQQDKEPIRVMNYSIGDYFGERALLNNQPRAANVLAETDVTLLKLDRKAFKRLLGPIQDVLKRNMDLYAKYCGGPPLTRDV